MLGCFLALSDHKPKARRVGFSSLLVLLQKKVDLRGMKITHLPAVTSEGRLLRRLRSCSVIIAPESDSDAFNFFVWEGFLHGSVVLVRSDSGECSELKKSIPSRKQGTLEMHCVTKHRFRCRSGHKVAGGRFLSFCRGQPFAVAMGER